MARHVLHQGNAKGVVQEAPGQVQHLGGHGGGKEPGAPLLRAALQDGFQLVPEAQIQHVISLVEDHGVHPVEAQRSPAQVIQHPSRGAHHDARPATELAKLGGHFHSPHQGGRLHPYGGAEVRGLPRGLERQLPRGGQHQHPGGTSLSLPGIQKRQRKRQGLARPRGGLHHRIPRYHVRSQHLLLHRRGSVKTPVLQRDEELSPQAEPPKIRVSHLRLQV